MKQDELIFRADFLFHELKLNSYDEHCKKKLKFTLEQSSEQLS